MIGETFITFNDDGKQIGVFVCIEMRGDIFFCLRTIDGKTEVHQVYNLRRIYDMQWAKVL